MYSTKYSADGKRHTKLRCSALSELRLSPKSSFNRSSAPHRKGGFRPAGGGTCLPMVRKKSPRKPSGVQLAIPILPPGLKILSVTLLEVDLPPLCSRPLPSFLQQRGDVVDADHLAKAPSGGQCRVAVAARYVEHPLPGA